MEILDNAIRDTSKNLYTLQDTSGHGVYLEGDIPFDLSPIYDLYDTTNDFDIKERIQFLRLNEKAKNEKIPTRFFIDLDFDEDNYAFADRNEYEATATELCIELAKIVIPINLSMPLYSIALNYDSFGIHIYYLGIVATARSFIFDTEPPSFISLIKKLLEESYPMYKYDDSPRQNRCLRPCYMMTINKQSMDPFFYKPFKKYFYQIESGLQQSVKKHSFRDFSIYNWTNDIVIIDEERKQKPIKSSKVSIPQRKILEKIRTDIDDGKDFGLGNEYHATPFSRNAMSGLQNLEIDEIFKVLNHHFAILIIGGKRALICGDYNIKGETCLSYTDIGQVQYSIEKQIEGKSVNIFEIWKKSAYVGARTFNGVTFDPTLTDRTIEVKDQNIFNSFDGLPFMDVEEFMPSIIDYKALKIVLSHVYNILCDKKFDMCRCLIEMIGVKLTNPAYRPHFMLCFFSAFKGIFKSTFTQLVQSLFGKYGILFFFINSYILGVQTTVNNILSQFNVAYKDSLLINLDELNVSGRQRICERMKMLVTQEEDTIEIKNGPKFNSPVYRMIIATSNDPNPYRIFSADDDTDVRRLLGFKCNKYDIGIDQANLYLCYKHLIKNPRILVKFLKKIVDEETILFYTTRFTNESFPASSFETKYACRNVNESDSFNTYLDQICKRRYWIKARQCPIMYITNDTTKRKYLAMHEACGDGRVDAFEDMKWLLDDDITSASKKEITVFDIRVLYDDYLQNGGVLKYTIFKSKLVNLLDHVGVHVQSKRYQKKMIMEYKRYNPDSTFVNEQGHCFYYCPMDDFIDICKKHNIVKEVISEERWLNAEEWYNKYMNFEIDDLNEEEVYEIRKEISNDKKRKCNI